MVMIQKDLQNSLLKGRTNCVNRSDVSWCYKSLTPNIVPHKSEIDNVAHFFIALSSSFDKMLEYLGSEKALGNDKYKSTRQ